MNDETFEDLQYFISDIQRCYYEIMALEDTYKKVLNIIKCTLGYQTTIKDMTSRIQSLKEIDINGYLVNILIGKNPLEELRNHSEIYEVKSEMNSMISGNRYRIYDLFREKMKFQEVFNPEYYAKKIWDGFVVIKPLPNERYSLKYWTLDKDYDEVHHEYIYSKNDIMRAQNSDIKDYLKFVMPEEFI